MAEHRTREAVFQLMRRSVSPNLLALLHSMSQSRYDVLYSSWNDYRAQGFYIDTGTLEAPRVTQYHGIHPQKQLDCAPAGG